MANKIYIGDQEIGSTGGGGSTINPSDFVDASTWDEHEKVIASALVNLKSLEGKIEEFDESIQAQETALLAEVHVVEQQKADASVVYTKTEIDNSDKVVAAALAELNDRVSTLESLDYVDTSTLESLDYVDTSTLDASLNEFTYSKERIDASLAEIAAASGGSETPIPSNILQYFEVSETGFFFVDASLNIGVSIDSSGLHAPNLVEYNEIS